MSVAAPTPQPPSLSSLTLAPTSKYTIFENWLLSNGAKFPDLELRAYDDPTSSSKPDKESKTSDPSPSSPPSTDDDSEMRGVHALRDLPPNNVCVSVPRKCLITVEMGKSTSIGQAILRNNLDLDAPKHVFLMVFILKDRKDSNSFFKPYYDILPPGLNNMPIFWTPEELKLLTGSYLLKQISDRKEAITEDYNLITSVCPELSSIATLQDFMWARMCVCSRNFGLLINGLRTSALVPHADMLNHFRPRETKWTFDNDSQCFTITTLQGIRGGDQIYDSYGQKCNHRFLLNYGFAVEDNKEQDGFCPNEVPIEITLQQQQSADDDNYSSLKTEFWTRDSSPITKRVRVCVSNNDNTKSLLSMLRVAASNGAELQAITQAGPYMYRSVKDVRFSIGVDNEIRAMELLKNIVDEQMKAYPTSIKEDELALKGPSLVPYSNDRHARIQVLGEKRVLEHYSEFANSAIECLNGELGDDEFDQMVEKVGREKHHTIAQYVKDVVGGIRREERRRERKEGEEGGGHF
ncbi:hypothetical protein TrST_g4232 [Triparma strigata]|uniref:SET domain-containing protein n=1 Tax=Triparma strigata TaxID=1606541 RepID=A0A9W6ZKE9_9STRA|nr:hypothetical protein TrST_g4232 [Triparma strigata]